MSKKKAAANKGKVKGATKDAEDDDWDAILSAEVAANQVFTETTKPASTEATNAAVPSSDTTVPFCLWRDSFSFLYL